MLRKLLSILGIYRLYEKWLWYQVKDGKKPDHVAIILDGNRRWASEKRVLAWIGHRYGAQKVETFLDWCLDIDVRSITLYAFSTENFQRSRKEVNEIMQILEEKLHRILTHEKIHKHRVRVKAIGRLNLLPQKLREVIRQVEKSTKEYDEHFLNLALAYGGRAEIVDATIKIAEKVRSREIDPSDIDETLFEKNLYTAYMAKQDPDLIIRTSGEERLSGFLLWQSAYSEFCFMDITWPDFRRIDLLRAVRTYQRRKRRYGK